LRHIAELAFICLGACAAQPGVAPTESARPLLDDLADTLAAQESATAALTEWCAARRIAAPPVITARQVKAEIAAPSPAMRSLLAAGPDEPIRYRHVELRCGATVLSVAENWYVPARLTPGMNAALDNSDAPFGRVAAPLHFTRQRLESQRGQSENCPAGTILSNQALLKLPDDRPISAVTECYTAANLAPAR
jgi:hypothetical protein